MAKRAGIRSGDIKEVEEQDSQKTDERTPEELKADIDKALGRQG